MKNQEEKQECCPKFDPAPWDIKTFEWTDKKFIKDKVFTLFYIPINFGMVMKRMGKIVDAEKAETPDWLCLSEHTSKWKMDISLAVNKEVAGAQNAAISGKFFSKVYEGDFKDTGKWLKDFENIAKEKKLQIKTQYFWYTTCPKCAKKYGKNYVVLIAKIG